MHLNALRVQDLRILSDVRLTPGAGVNLIVGPNGAGKTSILESIHVLASGRSFAATRAGRLIRHGGGPLRVFARVGGGTRGDHRVGLEKGASGPGRMRLDGQPAERMTDLARLLPVVAIHPESHEIIAGGPGERRRLLNLGLFHVEHEFHAAWQRYRRGLAQRNALLRAERPSRELVPWDRELAGAGEVLDGFRQRYVDALAESAAGLQERLFDSAEAVELEYRRGWSDARSLGEALEAERHRSGEMASTGVGPHRADLAIRLDGRDVRQRVSRGQQKLLVYLLRLAQAQQLGVSPAGGCILLLDDLPAELDAERRGRVAALARDIGAQVFATALEPASVELPTEAGARTFHVEQGRVREMI